MKILNLRPAIAMIELIFSIVIMGIVLMSAPMLISTSSKSTYVGMQQEGINEVASKVNMILSYAWDENDTADDTTPPLLLVDGNTLFDPDATSPKDNRTRIGIPLKSSRVFKSDLNVSDIGLDDGESSTSDADDIDDFNGESLASLVNIENASTDYVESTTIKIDTTIVYGDDSFVDGETYNYVPFKIAGKSNIKNIEVTLISTDVENADILAKSIVLRAFSCNIGGISYAEKWF